MTQSAETRKSKSQRKRESLALQSLAESLVALAAADLARLPLWPDLEAAVSAARGMERSAFRRQIRYIARLLRENDPEPIGQALDDVRRPGRREAARHRRIERLRDTLIEDEEALDRMREACLEMDLQHLRRLVTAARRERASANGRAGERRLFRYIRDQGLDAAGEPFVDG